jgi:hypothetical protein
LIFHLLLQTAHSTHETGWRMTIRVGENMKKIVNELLKLNTINGGTVWDRADGSVYNPIGFSTIDFLNVIGDSGIDIRKNEIAQKGIEKIIEYYNPKTALFRYSNKSPKLPCISAKIITLLKKNSVQFPYYEDCYQYFFNSQQSDGGWRCATVKMGKSPDTDASNPGTTLYVLDAFRFRENDSKELGKLNKAVGFLLNHWISKKPLGPCRFGIGTTFMKTEYPFVRYNIYYYSYVLSFYKKARNDKRFKEILSQLIDKVTDDEIEIENPNKNWKKLLYKNNKKCDLANLKLKKLFDNLKKS